MAGGSHMALDIRIAGRYRLGRKIGSGSFGDIYLGAAPAPRELCCNRRMVSRAHEGATGR